MSALDGTTWVQRRGGDRRVTVIGEAARFRGERMLRIRNNITGRETLISLSGLLRRFRQELFVGAKKQCSLQVSHEAHQITLNGPVENALYCPGLPCDHANRCCRKHRVHVTPHRGCILR